MRNAAYYRAEAARCRGQALVSDSAEAAALRGRAEEFEARAREIEQGKAVERDG